MREDGPLPQQVEAEQEVLGALMLDNDLGRELLAVATPPDFFHPAHERIAATAEALLDQGRRADPMTLAGYLHDEEALVAVGGAEPYLRGLVDAVSSRAAAPAYAALVRDLALRRRTIDVARIMIDDARNPIADVDARDIVLAGDAALLALLDRSGSTAVHDMAGAVDAALEAAEAQHAGTAAFRVPTGLSALDHLIGGLPVGGYAVLGGRPSMGKTALGLQIALNAARSGVGVAFISLEQPLAQLGARWLAAAANVPATAIDRGLLESDQWHRLAEARTEIDQLPVRIIARRAMTPGDLRTAIGIVRRQIPLGLVIVDYLQQVRPPRLIPGSPVREITEVSSHLAALFGEMNVAGFVLSQLSRQVEGRADKRPQLSDLRETGAIEQDADLVMFAYRDAYYLERARPDRGADQGECCRWRLAMDVVGNALEVLVAKNRQGPIGTADLCIDLATGRCFDPEPAGQEQ